MRNGKALGFTVFHDCALPPDDFVANCRLAFTDLKIGSQNDIWIDLEPHGQLHVNIELSGTKSEGKFWLFFNLILSMSAYVCGC